MKGPGFFVQQQSEARLLHGQNGKKCYVLRAMRYVVFDFSPKIPYNLYTNL
jgi:hypothetical protein